MTERDLTEEVERLLMHEIESYEQLESLLLLSNHPDLRLGADEAASRLGIGSELALEALVHLCARGLAVRDTGPGGTTYRYSTERPDLDVAVRTLARIYPEKRVEVVRQMTANAIQRIRTSSIRVFADSFLLKGQRKRDDG